MAQQLGPQPAQPLSVGAPQDAGLRPHPKLVTATTAAALVTIVVWCLGMSGVQVPPQVATAIATVLAGTIGYWTPSAAASTS
jgi:hypothetical protein